MSHPKASRTEEDTKFSDGIKTIDSLCRCFSSSRILKRTGSRVDKLVLVMLVVVLVLGLVSNRLMLFLNIFKGTKNQRDHR